MNTTNFRKLLAVGMITGVLNLPTATFAASSPLEQFLNSDGEKPLTKEETDAAKALGVNDSELYQVRSPMTAEAKRAVKLDLYDASQDLEKFSRKTDAAMEKLISRAAYVLEAKGYKADAAQLTAEYSQFYSQAVYYTYLGVQPVNIGDHKPLNQWLADWYDKIEAKIGVTLCKALHLIDIKILNYGIPVVFHPKGRPELNETYTLPDYQDHFGGHMTSNVMFAYHGVAGVVGYWVAWGTCVVGTAGGGVAFICGIVGSGIEWGMDKFVSPPVSKLIYCKANGTSTDGCQK